MTKSSAGEPVSPGTTKRYTFRPWPWLLVYVGHLVDALAEGTRPPTQGKLAELCGVHRVTVAKALGRQDVRTWLVDRLGIDDNWKTRQIMSRIAGQALAGSKDHQRIWLELQGRLRSAFAPGGGDGPKIGDGWVIQMNVPLPAPLPPGSLEPVGAIDVLALPLAAGEPGAPA